MTINALLLALIGATSDGALFGIMAIGVYLTYRILDVADLTVDGSFATGGAVCAICIANGINPIIATIIAMLAGLLCGLFTGILHTKFKIPAILSGILTMIALYSVNMRILGGKSNLPLIGESTMMKSLVNGFSLSQNFAKIIVGVIFIIIAVAL